jgi:hypothetical protein
MFEIKCHGCFGAADLLFWVHLGLSTLAMDTLVRLPLGIVKTQRVFRSNELSKTDRGRRPPVEPVGVPRRKPTKTGETRNSGGLD